MSERRPSSKIVQQYTLAIEQNLDMLRDKRKERESIEDMLKLLEKEFQNENITKIKREAQKAVFDTLYTKFRFLKGFLIIDSDDFKKVEKEILGKQNRKFNKKTV